MLTLLRAFFTRELHTMLRARSSVPLVLGSGVLGIAVAALPAADDVASLAPYYLLQVWLYLLPLAAILAATGSAQAGKDEQALLHAIPGGRLPRILGKFLGLLMAFSLAIIIVVAPVVVRGLPLQDSAILCAYGLGAASVFLTLGLLSGFLVRDGIRAHMTALAIWLVAVFGAGLPGYLILQFAADGVNAQAWSLLMMLSPLDALRVGLLFSINAAPFDQAALPGIARLWLSNAGAWFALICVGFTAGASGLALRCLRHIEG